MIELTTPQLSGLPKGMPAVGVSLGMTSDFALALAQITPPTGVVAPAVTTAMTGEIVAGFAPVPRQALAAPGNALPPADSLIAPEPSSPPSVASDTVEVASPSPAGEVARPAVTVTVSPKLRHPQVSQPKPRPAFETQDSGTRAGASRNATASIIVPVAVSGDIQRPVAPAVLHVAEQPVADAKPAPELPEAPSCMIAPDVLLAASPVELLTDPLAVEGAPSDAHEAPVAATPANALSSPLPVAAQPFAVPISPVADPAVDTVVQASRPRSDTTGPAVSAEPVVPVVAPTAVPPSGAARAKVPAEHTNDPAVITPPPRRLARSAPTARADLVTRIVTGSPAVAPSIVARTSVAPAPVLPAAVVSSRIARANPAEALPTPAPAMGTPALPASATPTAKRAAALLIPVETTRPSDIPASARTIDPSVPAQPSPEPKSPVMPPVSSPIAEAAAPARIQTPAASAPVAASATPLTVSEGSPVAAPEPEASVLGPTVDTVQLKSPEPKDGASPVRIALAAPRPVIADVAVPATQPAGQAFAAAMFAAEPGVRPVTRPRAGESAQPLSVESVMGSGAPILHPVVQPATEARGAPLDLGRQDWMASMIDRIETIRDESGARATRIRLAPDALGAIDLSLRQDERGELKVHINAETPQARALLAEAAPRLADMAEARGLKLGGSFVDSGAAQGDPRRDPQRPETASPARPASALAANDADDTTTESRIA